MSDDESSPVIDYYFAKSQAGRTGQNKFHNEVLPQGESQYLRCHVL